MPCPRARRPVPCLLLAVLLAAPPAATAAVTAVTAAAAPQAAPEATAGCDLRTAAAEHDAGRLDRALELLVPCPAAGLPPDELEGALALLAKVYLALDRIEEARDAVAQLLELDSRFAPAFDDPPRFVQAVAEARRGGSTVVVSSVSKTPESLREAPATVVVVTAEEIARRGYWNLEQVLHDLPGFDMARGNGDIYSLFYQRGYRSQNDRTLFLVDGVEENDIWCNAAFLSPQYALGDVERVEVVYGPASTMYGANAFVGVINVITRDPESLFRDDDRAVAAEARLGGGAWETRWGEATVALRHREKNVAFSLTGRAYRSDEMDLSEFPEWDFDPGFYDGIRYGEALGIEGAEAVAAFLGGLSPEARAALEASPLVAAERRDGAIVALRPTPAGEALARGLDRAALGQVVEGRPVGFSDTTDDWSVYGKLRLGGLTLGFQTWRREEGFNSWYTDSFYAGAENGTLWIPEQSFFWARFERDLGRRLGLTVASSFKRHVLADDTREQQLLDYATGDLDLADLATGVPSHWRTTFYSLTSDQFRTEATLVWQRSRRLTVVGGVEGRSSLVQGDFIRRVENSAQPGVDGGTGESRFFDQLDLGAFAQASYRLREHWKLVLGGRLDHNEARPDGGYGDVFNPRAAVVYARGPWVVKGIYAEAFKDASNFNRYAIAPGFRDLPNPDLEPEKVRNVELAAGWQPHEALALDLSAYRAVYSDAVVTRRVPFGEGTTLQNQSLGTLEIAGVEARARWRFRALTVDANYTWSDPKSIDPKDEAGRPLTGADGRVIAELAVGEIAEHHVNLALNARLQDRFNVNLRANWVGERRAGEPPGVAIDPYLVTHAALTWEDVRPGLDLQLAVENLFDERYEHPGVSPADGIALATRLPQNRRGLFARLAYGF